ncbi:MAG: TRAP transporter substrate-binding protein [Syntrophus sp. (in: bacteria)]|nr:TRAP transporter substrate-binding protein [Syntrophus sp. (in: bacteria)]
MLKNKFLKEGLREHASAIYQTTVEELMTWQGFIRDVWPLLILLLAALGFVILLAKPAPPKHVTMASGKGGSYHVLAQKYVEFFRKNGVTLELFPTHGAQENLARLKDRQDPVIAAFVQGGIAKPGDTSGILSLGSIDYEPVWFFYRSGDAIENDKDIHRILKMRIAIGPVGSGTHTQAMHILELNGIAPTSILLTMPNPDAAQALQRGEIDAVFMVDGIESADVQTLLKDPKIRLANFRRAAAYTRLSPFIEKLEVPMGGFDLARNFPSKDTQLIATTTNLLIDDRMHPAIQMLFLLAAQDINGKESYFARRGEFPSFKDPVVPESKVAVRFRQKGPPFLMDYLPFWLAEFIDRMFLLLVPFFVVAYPIVKAMPEYRLKPAKARINKVYSELKFFEQELLQSYDSARHDEYILRLNAMESDALGMKLPKILASNYYYYSLRKDIDFVRSRLSRENPYGAKANNQGE